ncbi:hypothetical protein [Streptomyces sp. NPDC058955]|uniref:hypothetical protein n=1 Tax=unclassified Streptomyces TaxID=2593676 RepID=UPI003667D350
MRFGVPMAGDGWTAAPSAVVAVTCLVVRFRAASGRRRAASRLPERSTGDGLMWQVGGA